MKGSKPIYIKDDSSYNLEDFVIPYFYKDCIDKILIPCGLIEDRIRKIAYDIRNYYGDKPLHLLCLLKVFYLI